MLHLGATINVTPTTPNGWTVIESADAGDEVVIAPGTYKYRVYLTHSGTAQAPIVIRAQEPSNKPLFDLTGMAINLWPGDTGVPGTNRGAFQVRGDHYRIS